METTVEINEIVGALSALQSEVSAPEMSGLNKFLRKGNTGGEYSMLKDIIKALKPHLNKNGLSYSSSIENTDNQQYCVTRIFHKSGQFLEDSIPLIMSGKNDMQSLGSAITYARRYSLQNLFGLSGDENQEDDGEAIKESDDSHDRRIGNKTKIADSIMVLAGQICKLKNITSDTDKMKFLNEKDIPKMAHLITFDEKALTILRDKLIEEKAMATAIKS